jgi:multisubunit Na+/H+ antiporter MnhE subunit
MAFWVWADDSLALAELLAGAGAAAIGASVAELVQHQSATHFRPRAEWVAPALRLPMKLVKDTALVAKVLWARIVHGQDPPSAFRAVPVRGGGSSPEDVTRRVLMIAGMSFTPNTFALGIDSEHGLMFVHQLVSRPEVPGQ